MPTFKRITKREAFKRFVQDQPIYLCPFKMRPTACFNMACLILGKEYLEKAKGFDPASRCLANRVWKGSVEKTAWAIMYNNWICYNASHEVGYYPHYYVQQNGTQPPERHLVCNDDVRVL